MIDDSRRRATAAGISPEMRDYMAGRIDATTYLRRSDARVRANLERDLRRLASGRRNTSQPEHR